MIRVLIGSSERSLPDATESWISEQVDRRRQDGDAICVQVVIQHAGLNLRLSTPGCGSSGGSRPPRPEERHILDLWDRHNLSAERFQKRDLVGFLRGIEGYR